MMGVASPTASHLPVLTAACDALPPGSLVIEHGAGMYSTPLLAALDVKVHCHEPHPAWAEWARWIYGDDAVITDSMEFTTARLCAASVVFLDGPAKERGVLLPVCLAAGVATIIVHDTNKREWHFYGFTREMFEDARYDVTHHAEDSNRTTIWKLRA